MIVLVAGDGFIGSQIINDLLAEKYEVIGCGRNIKKFKQIYPNSNYIEANFNQDITLEAWQQKLSPLKKIDVIINCIGVLQASDETMWNIHFHAPKFLVEAAQEKSLQKVIQVSALGVDKIDIPFAASKKAFDDYLKKLPLETIVLRPSLVYGRGSYGGTSLFRGLAGLPGFTPVPGKGEELFQPIHIADLSKAAIHLINKKIDHEVFTAVGPNRISLWEILISIRKWLGFGGAIKISLPNSMTRIAVKIGDKLHTTLNSTLYKMLLQNNVSTEAETLKFQNTIEFIPRKFEEALNEPSYVQDRWHARLYFLRPLLRLSIGFMWVFTAIISLFFYPVQQSIELINIIGLSSPKMFFYSAVVLDFILGLATLCNYKIRVVGSLQILIMLGYTLIISIWLPQYWLEPFGPVLKNIPLLVATGIMMAMESKR